jgi:heme/copper-type cytochrome/quinol oxidase subunit 3
MKQKIFYFILISFILFNSFSFYDKALGAIPDTDTAFSIPVQIPTTTDDFIKIILGLLIYIVPTIVLFVIMYAAYLLMTSKGDPKQVKKAMDIIKWAIIGFIAVILAWSIKNFIVDFFTK